jgi:hypothetical protein
VCTFILVLWPRQIVFSQNSFSAKYERRSYKPGSDAKSDEFMAQALMCGIFVSFVTK